MSQPQSIGSNEMQNPPGHGQPQHEYEEAPADFGEAAQTDHAPRRSQPLTREADLQQDPGPLESERHQRDDGQAA